MRRSVAAALLGLLALAFLVAHLLAGGGLLDDLDAINFAMGVRDFDVARHQPHPPGYPLYIVLGKALTSLGGLLGGRTEAPGTPIEARALWLLSVLAGSLAVWPLATVFRRLAPDDRIALPAVLLAIACPLFWVTASRPLSDMPGLAAALAVQGILATAFVRQQGWRSRAVLPEELVATGRLIVVGALLAGAIAGLRSQTVWLTVPLLVVVIADRAGRGAAAAIVGSGVTFLVGILSWLVPMAVAVGGPLAYWRALTSQAGEDFEGVDMLLTSTQPVRRLAFNLLETFVLPWVSLPLAAIVLALAVAGVVVLLRHDRRTLTLVTVLAAPYALFHLLLQENVTTRYALPLVPMTAWLAVRGLQTIGRAAQPILSVGLAAAAVCVAHPALASYASIPPPIFRVFADMRAGAGGLGAGDPDAPVVAMHRRLLTESKRAREWLGEAFPWRLLPAPRGHEWIELTRYWRDGGQGRVWFLADERRTDLALVDPASRHDNGVYAWPFAEAAAVVGGTRPDAMRWVVMDSPPAWFLGEGWALTPETAGVAEQGRKGPAQGGAVGWIRRTAGPLRVVIGGRNLAGAGEPVRFSFSVDGTERSGWVVPPTPGFFLRAIDLPAGAVANGRTPFAEVVVTAAPADGSTSRRVAAAVEQFDVQAPDRVQAGYADGWHEDEYHPRTGLRWRWTSDRAAVRVWPHGRDVRLRLSAESPLETFDEAPIVRVAAGGRELARLQPREAFTIDVRVPADALAQADGLLTIATTQVFVPAERVGAHDPRRHDRRRLGLRVFTLRVTPVP